MIAEGIGGGTLIPLVPIKGRIMKEIVVLLAGVTIFENSPKRLLGYLMKIRPNSKWGIFEKTISYNNFLVEC